MTTEPPLAVPLPQRGVLAVGGPDRVSFLQGLVSNDVARVSEGRAVWAALLTAQGKYLHDFCIAARGEELLLDCEAARRDDLLRRLRPYRLRAQVTLEDRTDALAVSALVGTAAPAALELPAEPGAARTVAGGTAFVDPRHAALGLRLILPREDGGTALAGFRQGGEADWDSARLALGVPDGSRDLVPEKSILLENGFDELHGVAWDKGCWMGQELTARTRYRGLIRKRLLPVEVCGPLPAPGTPVFLGEREAGEMRSGHGGQALALLRLEEVERAAAEGLSFRAGETTLSPRRPSWMG